MGKVNSEQKTSAAVHCKSHAMDYRSTETHRIRLPSTKFQVSSSSSGLGVAFSSLFDVIWGMAPLSWFSRFACH